MAADPAPIPPDLALDDPPLDLGQIDEAIAVVQAQGDPLVSLLAYEPDEKIPVGLPEPVMRWRITDDGSAEWAMRHLAVIQAERAAVDEQAREWLDRIQEWVVARTRPLSSRAAFFEAHLTRYALERRATSDGKQKTLVLPSGAVPTTEHKPKIAVTDESQLVAWVEENLEPDEISVVVKVVESVLVSELRRHVVLVELPGRVILTPCGCVAVPAVDAERVEFDSVAALAAWAIGSAVTCPQCGDDALVGRWTEIALAVRDEAGRPVPGAGVVPGDVTARVVPA